MAPVAGATEPLRTRESSQEPCRDIHKNLDMLLRGFQDGVGRLPCLIFH